MANAYDTLLATYSPVAWWKLADAVNSSTAADSSGNGNTGTVSGTVTFGETGPTSGDTAALFDGSTGEIDTTFTPSGTDFSFVIWYQNVNTAGASDGRILGNESGNDGAWIIELQSATGLTGERGFVGNGSSTVENYGSPTSTGWHMVAITFDGASFVIYDDGVESDSESATSVTWGTSGITIGSEGGFNYFNGYLAQAAIFESTLSQAQITALFNAATAISGTGLLGASFVATAAGTSVKGGSLTASFSATAVGLVTIHGAGSFGASFSAVTLTAPATSATGSGLLGQGLLGAGILGFSGASNIYGAAGSFGSSFLAKATATTSAIVASGKLITSFQATATGLVTVPGKGLLSASFVATATSTSSVNRGILTASFSATATGLVKAVGTGRLSASFSAAAAGTAPLGQPTDVFAIATVNGASVQWGPPLTGSPSSYTVAAYQGNNVVGTPVMTPPFVFAVIFNDLFDGIPYDFEVVANA